MISAQVEDYQDASVRCCAQLHDDPDCAGDVLVFLPGQEEIAACKALLEERLAGSPKPFVVQPCADASRRRRGVGSMSARGATTGPSTGLAERTTTLHIHERAPAPPLN